MLTFGNSVVKIGGGWVDHITLPAKTLRFRFSKADLDPRAYTSQGTFTKVSGSMYNDWDWTYNSSSWRGGPFNYITKSDSGLGTYEVIAAGDTSGVTSFNSFFGYSGIQVVFGPTRVCQINTRNATDMTDMFRNCLSLVEVGSFDITSVVTGAAAGLVYMFAYTAITKVPVFTGSKVMTSDTPFFLSGMFQGCAALSDISNLHTIRVSWDPSTEGTNSGLIINTMFADVTNPLFAVTGHEWDGSGSRIKNFNSHLATSSSQRSAFAGCTFKNDMINVLSWPLMDTAILTDLFKNTGMTSIPTIPTITAKTLNFAGAFANNPDIDTGMLAAYNYLKTLQGVSGSNCFQNSGTDTVQGMSDRASIPEAWGGDYVVPAVTVGTGWSKVSNSSSAGTIWQFTSNIDFSTLVSMQLYTDSSISSYAGVNMRKTNIGNRKGTFSNATSSPCFYYPAFVQISYGTLTWFMTSTSYNGTLAAGSSAGDMPGTLSYNTYGDHSVQFGTYDSTKNVRFCFLVFNSDALDASCLNNFGILYNANFYVDPGLKAVGGTVNPQSAIIG